jgi:phosphoglycolate phosphatase-like HAD superfamily hydrolase
MHLVIFDIDGTLTETVKLDEEFFLRSLAEVCGFCDVETDWSTYKHATDSGIFREIHEARTGRPALADEVSRFRQHFVALVARAISKSAIAPIVGAPQLLSVLTGSAEYRVSLATGGWRDSARLKMASAGMCFDDHPSASADDALDRESIMKLSMQRAAERHGGPFAGTVHVGDAVWDARACRAMGIPFIGIGSGVRAARLASEGAIRVFADFSDRDLFLESLDGLTQAAVGKTGRRV